jgi:hippurate hydrolase
MWWGIPFYCITANTKDQKTMRIRDEIKNLHDEMMEWRHELHKHPETAFEEAFASKFVQKKLDDFGIEYKTGYAQTGFVATIEGKTNKSGRAIGLRSDLDALDICEDSGKTWTSKNEGKMHACGHDGHMTMLLGAAKYLKENPNFDGKVHCIFQPAEETLMGARGMINDGLFKDFPCDQIYGMHNWPWISKGKFGMREGGLMASVSYLEVTIIGKAGHSGMLSSAIDPVIIGCEIITSIQTLVSQATDPMDPASIYFPIFETGVHDAGVVPETVTLKGVLRTFSSGLRSHLEQRTRTLCTHIASAHGGNASVIVACDSDEVFNHEETTDIARKAAASIVGPDNVDMHYAPSMSGEDFGSFLREVPGTFIFIGQGEPDHPKHSSSFSIHSPYYDFNDDILPIGVQYWVNLAESALPLED